MSHEQYVAMNLRVRQQMLVQLEQQRAEATADRDRTMPQQQSVMKYDPATGVPCPYPSHAEQWRVWHGKMVAWLYNPWTGSLRLAGDVGTDPYGQLILPPGEQLCAGVDKERSDV
jgi:hypothetical protein